MLLAPCPACRRHIAASACPFCGAGATTAATLTPTPLGRVSRAMVMGAALLGGGACGSKAKPAEQTMPEETDWHQDHPCSVPDPAKVEELEKKKADAQTDEEKAQIEQELAEARQPVCAPYGAPPARRRVV